MKRTTKIDTINLRNAIVKNRRLLTARERPEVRAWALYAMLGLFFLGNGILIAVLRLFGG